MINDSQGLANLIHTALLKHFGNTSKSHVKLKSDRINFACPICNDSDKDPNRKRGNIWLKTNSYKCYNCGYFSSLKKFLFNLFNLGLLEENIPEDFMLESSYESLSNSLNLSTIGFISNELEDVIHKYGFDRELFKKYFSAIEILGTPMEGYLKFRNVKDFSKFLYLPTTRQLIVLNIDNLTGKIISFQIRNFGKNVKDKYLTYKLEKIYTELKIKIPEDDSFFRLDELSKFFNLLNIDMNLPITYFEGPIDCYFYKNSISLNSVHSSPPFDSFNCRYFFDFDKEGRKKMTELIMKKKTVFLWRKFLKDIKIEYNNFQKIDFNDIVTFLVKEKLKVDFERYFSNDPLNLILI